MAHFYASINGSAKTAATRCGNKRSGITGHVRGWTAGVQVDGYATDDGRDYFKIYATSGSSGGRSVLLGVVSIKDERDPVFSPAY